MKLPLAVVALVALAPQLVLIQVPAQAPCGTQPHGIVRDSTAAIVPGASLALDGAAPILSASDGTFRLPCLTAGRHRLHLSAPTFSPLDLTLTAPLRQAELTLVLQPAPVETSLDVSGDDTPAAASPTSAGPSQTISGTRLQSLADDPDDLLRELQQLAAASGGSPSSAQIKVDGFQGGEGGTTLPPKNSIAYIKVNPDLYSAEYRQPPFGGGQIEVYTKPGQSTFHGSLFATNGSSWMNARDPFSASRASLGKQRYGFSLTGPLRKKGADFSLDLEHRSIDNAAVIDAVTSLDSSGNPATTVANVPTPQRLWVGNARIDWQLSPRNTFIASYGANHNQLHNLGVGGTTLADAAYGALRFDNNLHLTLATTVSARLMHEQRLGIEWDGETDTPISTAPQIQVSGAFTGGGASVGPQRTREVDIEDTDDAILSTKNHLLKVGLQSSILDQHKRLTTNFNGAYAFGGYTTATGVPVSGLQQYLQALAGTPGVTPTDFNNVAGNPEVDLVQLRFALFFQDDWKLRPNLHVAYGLRYYTQSDPTVVGALTPRLGIAWSPDKKATWTLHAHAGTFANIFFGRTWAEILRMDGVQRVTSTVYNPTAYCPSGITTACTPFGVGATAINSIRTVAPKLPDTQYAIENLGFTHSFPKGWNLSADYYIAQMWHYTRSENINSPTNGSSTGPRPFGPNLNILQVQGTGRGYGSATFLGLEQHSLKRLQLFVGAVRVDIIDDTDDGVFYTPQTTGINTGEYARRDNNPLWQVFGNATLTLPAKLQLSANFNGSGDQAYNVTTGQDNNGDGDFNDRPRFAPTGTPVCTATTTTACAYASPWGLLTPNGTGPTLSRDKANLPWDLYLDMNLQRTFHLSKDPKAAHPQTLSANIRSSNIVNHQNVTAVGSVIGSPLFAVSYAADPGRRVEAGLRYSF